MSIRIKFGFSTKRRAQWIERFILLHFVICGFMLSEISFAQNNNSNDSNIENDLNNFSLENNFDNNVVNNFDNDLDNSEDENFSNNNITNNSENEDFSNSNSAETADENAGGINNASAEFDMQSEDFDDSAMQDPFTESSSATAPSTSSSGASGSSSEGNIASIDPLGGVQGFSVEKYDSGLRNFNSDVKRNLRQRLEADLRTYCFHYCSVLSFDVTSAEVFDAATPELGFENTSKTERTFATERVLADVLVDIRYGDKNTERLKKLMKNITQTYKYPIEIVYTPIELPETDTSAKSVAEVKNQFNRRITDELERVARDFCPDECKVSDVQVQVEQASIDDIADGSLSRYIFARGARGAVYVKGVSASLTINADMDSERRIKVENIFREVLLPFGAVSLSLRQVSFPEAASEIQKQRDADRVDPYGLEKLRQMLQIFKEFAGTKEIIRETSSEKNASEMSSSSSLKESSSERSASSSQAAEISKLSEERSKDFESSLGLSENMLYVLGGILLMLVIAAAVGLRFVLTGKRMQQVVGEGLAGAPSGGLTVIQPQATHGGQSTHLPAGAPVQVAAHRGDFDSNRDFVTALEIARIKEELMQTFIRQPKVAREVFGRILKEEGVPYAAKCVAVFGEIVTFELMDDNEMKDTLATLAEYVHRNVPRVESSEELQILQALKLRVSAGKIKVMTDKGLGSFDFLKSKSPRQIYNLILDENSQSQSIVLTQLGKAKRNAIFDLFEGESKAELLRALCLGRVVANEYVLSLSDALRRKAQRSGIFDQGSTTGVDVLLDLLAQSTLSEQQNLMGELDATNPEAARMVRSSLVTPETLQFIRDGLMIEIFLGLEAQILATFLAGCPEHIRNMVLSKVPQDLAQDWYDMMNSIQSIDSENYKLAEMQILQKVRSFAESGMVSIIEINESLFPRQSAAGQAQGSGQRRFKISQSVVA